MDTVLQSIRMKKLLQELFNPIKDALYKTKELGWFYGGLAYVFSQFLLHLPAIIPYFIYLFSGDGWWLSVSVAYEIWVFAPTGTFLFYIPLLAFSIWLMRLIKNGGKTHEEKRS